MTGADLCALAAASYDDEPEGIICDWLDMRAILTERDGRIVVTVRGTDPKLIANLERDASVRDERSNTHPRLGLCATGPLEAAEGLLPLVLPHIQGRKTVLVGHSLGGWTAIPMAAMLVDMGMPPDLVVTFDSPKAGGLDLIATLAPVEIHQYRFPGSIVSDWPFWLNMQVREPLIEIGEWTPNPILAHSIDRARDWMFARESVAA